MSGNHISPHLNSKSSLIYISPTQKVASVFIFSLSLAFNDIRDTLVFFTILLCIFSFVFLSVPSINFLLKRMYIVIPFILFALLLPFISKGEIQIGTFINFPIYRNGVFEMLNILTKSLAGVAMAISLTSTTSQFDIIKGLEKLRMPKVLVAILSFAIRYISVYSSEFHRVRQSMKSRGFKNRSPKDSTTLAYAGSAMLIRGFERGEKVYQAMISRGFDGDLFINTQDWNRSNLLDFLCFITLGVNLIRFVS